MHYEKRERNVASVLVFYYSVKLLCKYVTIFSVFVLYEIKMEPPPPLPKKTKQNKKKQTFFFCWSNWEFFVSNWEKTPYFLALGMGLNFGPKIE